jgi:hypothetical protein
MRKLPVFATAGRAYGFLLREFATILRLAWFPTLVVVIVQYFATRALYAAMRSMIEAGNIAGASALATVSPWQIVSVVALLLGTAIVAVALHRVILFGDRRPGRFIHLAVGKVELLFALLPIAFYLATAGIFLSGALVASLSAAPTFVALLGVSAVVAFFFLAIRLLLIFPVTVVERRYDFSQTWALTRGNFWRILGLWIVVFVPILIVLAVVQFLIGGNVLPASTPMEVFDRIEALLIPTLVMTFVSIIVQGALGVGVLSYSYKALSGLAPDEVVSPRSS